ncbi:hypothetical protein MIZ03_1008 [Rhodoferax lithotrophicus]|uniref:Uncharacterized protein n=1 Tax=Rhodoferax lithotrophicus TaxID=2798804 RepID=A0ABN6D3N9_9BURK|nr:hypothetical protein [Rhodoferax sp. MIZ03]BCO26128.1 hypothetical protein MIZ03_1008 [Rhodoferax sp. MIZ03]
MKDDGRKGQRALTLQCTGPARKAAQPGDFERQVLHCNTPVTPLKPNSTARTLQLTVSQCRPKALPDFFELVAATGAGRVPVTLPQSAA